MGLLVLVGLTGLVVLAALSAARVGFPSASRTTLLVVTMVLCQAWIVTLSMMLGLMNALTAWKLALLASGTSVGTVALVVVHDGGWALYRSNTVGILRRFLAWPNDLVRACRYAGFPLGFTVAVAIGLVAWVALVIVVSPARGNEDAFYYHEPIVGFLIQNQGLAPVELPANMQRINGMPRFCHLLQTWFALYTGRTFVEMPNLLAHLLGVASIFGLARAIGVQKSAAIGWAVLFTLTPGVLRLTDAVMVDVHTAALVLAACYCVVVPRPLTVPSALVAATSCALVVGTKYHVIPISAILCLVLGLRMLAMRREWGAATTTATILSTAGVVLIAAAALFLRNYLLWENPIYPAGLRIESLDIDWRATSGLRNSWASGKGLPPLELLDKWFAAPFSVPAWTNPSARVEDYGIGTAYIAFPLALIAAARIVFLAIRRKRRGLPLDARLRAALALAAVMITAMATFPAPVRGRYYLGLVGVLFVLTAWLFRRPSRRRTGRQLLFAVQCMMVISVVWASRHDWVDDPWHVWTRLTAPAEERDFTERLLLTIDPDTGRARANELTEGKLVGFDEAKLIGVFWNDDYSSRVLYLGPRDTLKKADELGVDWLYLHRRTIEKLSADPRAAQWELVGKVMAGRRGVVPGQMYRRRSTTSPAPEGAPSPPQGE